MLSRIALLAALALPALEARVIVLKAARMFDGKANAHAFFVMKEGRIYRK